MIKTKKIKTIAIITTLGVFIGITGLALLNLNSKQDVKPIKTDNTVNHDIYLYKQDGSISLFNTKEKKYIEQHIVANKTSLDNPETYINFFDITKKDKNIYTSSPFSKELVIFSEEESGLNEVKRIKVNNIIENFKVVGDTVFIHYTNNPCVDVYELNSGKLQKTVSFSENVTSFEIDENYLYAGVGDYIEILPLNNFSISSSSKIYTGDKTISLLKSSDGFLYAANTFATDANKSVLIKIDINKKHVEDILEIGKEYPISMFEKDSHLYILCQGVTDENLDGISIIDKRNFKSLKNISTGDTPTSMDYTDDGYIYVSHEDGKVTLINAKNNFSTESSIVINGVKSIIIK